MDSSLHEVWQAAAGSPFVPTVGKDSQFLIAFVLLVFGFFLGGAFTLSRFCDRDVALLLRTWTALLIMLHRPVGGQPVRPRRSRFLGPCVR